MISRRGLLFVPTALVFAGAASVGGNVSAATLPPAVSLPAELAAALKAGKPLVVMASLDGCPFCRTVRDSHLAPLREEGQPVVQVDLGSKHEVRGFDGGLTTHEQLLRAWGITVAPTVLFFGRDGREVAQRLQGASIPDFYGAYLEQRLVAAGKLIR
jgi:thioredoxin-related protein